MFALAPSPPPDAAPAPGFAMRFLTWIRLAEAEARADAASALARASLHSALASDRREELLVAMTALTDDPEPMVRRALAEALAGESAAPRTLVVSLINDVSAVAAPLLARSPILTDAELAECAALGDAAAQCAIARRPGLGAAPALALAAKGGRGAVATLLDNCQARLDGAALEQVHARFADDPEIRDGMMARLEAGAALKAELAICNAAAETASAEPMVRERAERDAGDRLNAVLVRIAADCRRGEMGGLAGVLRERGALTMALLLRAILSGGDGGFFAEAVAKLADISSARAAGLARARGEAFSALLHKAGLPPHAAPAFRAALEALDTESSQSCGALKPRLVASAIVACEALKDPALAPIVALLWRFAAEAAKAEARDIANESERSARPMPPKLVFTPANDTLGRRLLLAVPAAPRRAA